MPKKLNKPGEVITFRPTKPMRQAIEKFCLDLNVSRTSVIEAALECFLIQNGCMAKAKILTELKKFKQ